MAAGCPFVTTAHGGIPDLVGDVDAGVMTREADAGALAEAMGALIARRAEWPQMARRGLAHMQETYSIAAVTDVTVAAYQRALATAPAASVGRVGG